MLSVLAVAFLCIILLFGRYTDEKKFSEADSSFRQQQLIECSSAAITQQKQILYPGEVIEAEAGTLRLGQSIRQTGGNQFEVSMIVDTSEKIRSYVGGSYTSVVLVIDNSYMTALDSASGPNGMLLPMVKKAALTFTDEFLALGAANEIAVVTTGTPSRIVQDMTNDKALLKEKIASIEVAESNFIQSGYEKARRILAGDSTHNQNRLIVHIASGPPLLSYEATSTSPTTEIIPFAPFGSDFQINSFRYEKVRGWGYSFLLGDVVPEVHPDDQLYQVGDYVVSDHCVPTISEALLAKKQDGISVYSIYFEDQVKLQQNNVSVRATRFTLRNLASGSSYYEASDVSSLETILTDIARKSSDESAPWTITAQLGSHINFQGFQSNRMDSAAEYHRDDETILWNLLHAQIVPEKLDSMELPYQYRYRLNYAITLDTDSESFVNGKPYPINETALLNYAFSKNLPDTGSIPNSLSTSIPIPQITGYQNPTIHVGASDLVSYSGGISANTNPFPNPQFTFGGFQGGDTLETIDFYMDGKKYEPQKNVHRFEVPFEEVFYYIKEDGAVSETPAKNDEQSGSYHIEVKGLNDAQITAVSRSTGIVYQIEYGTGTLFVRATSTNLDSSIVSQLTEEPTSPVTFPAVLIDPETKITDSTGNLFSGSQVSLLADRIIVDMTKKVMEARLKYKEETAEMEYDYFYLDLVDFEDGNHVLKSTGNVELYLPYPEGTNRTDDFVVMQLPGVNRQFDYHVPSAVPNWMSPEKTVYGLKMRLSDFSPFAIAYKKSADHNGSDSGSGGDADTESTEVMSPVAEAPGSIPKQSSKQAKDHNPALWKAPSQSAKAVPEEEFISPETVPEPDTEKQPVQEPATNPDTVVVKGDDSAKSPYVYWLLVLLLLLILVAIGAFLFYLRSVKENKN